MSRVGCEVAVVVVGNASLEARFVRLWKWGRYAEPTWGLRATGELLDADAERVEVKICDGIVGCDCEQDLTLLRISCRKGDIRGKSQGWGTKCTDLLGTLDREASSDRRDRAGSRDGGNAGRAACTSGRCAVLFFGAWRNSRDVALLRGASRSGGLNTP